MTNTELSHRWRYGVVFVALAGLEWARLPADVVFIGCGVVPLVIVTLLTYRHARVEPAANLQPIEPGVHA